MSGVYCTPRVPSYCFHKSSGQAVVTLNGRDHYLGKWNSKTSRGMYESLIGEWLANGRTLSTNNHAELTVAELALRYRNFAKNYCQKNDRPRELSWS